MTEEQSFILTSKINDTESEFKNDILVGLTQQKKQISSKYFYDTIGSELFNQITRHPDYYLTNCEIEILHAAKKKLSNHFMHSDFNLVELGVGEGLKTEILIEQFNHDALNFSYIPIDISSHFLRKITSHLNIRFPLLKSSGIRADYLSGLQWLQSHTQKRNFVIFLGSSIGNFDLQHTKDFMFLINQYLRPNDLILIGFDLQKDLSILLRAYDDSEKITARFNFNLLERINRELGGNFDPSFFQHIARYNQNFHGMESYLRSLKKHTITISALNRNFIFNEGEMIHVENSFKYSLRQINELALQTGFQVVDSFMDNKKWFVDSLWQKI